MFWVRRCTLLVRRHQKCVSWAVLERCCASSFFLTNGNSAVTDISALSSAPALVWISVFTISTLVHILGGCLSIAIRVVGWIVGSLLWFIVQGLMIPLSGEVNSETEHAVPEHQLKTGECSLLLPSRR